MARVRTHVARVCTHVARVCTHVARVRTHVARVRTHVARGSRGGGARLGCWHAAIILVFAAPQLVLKAAISVHDYDVLPAPVWTWLFTASAPEPGHRPVIWALAWVRGQLTTG